MALRRYRKVGSFRRTESGCAKRGAARPDEKGALGRGAEASAQRAPASVQATRRAQKRPRSTVKPRSAGRARLAGRDPADASEAPPLPKSGRGFRNARPQEPEPDIRQTRARTGRCRASHTGPARALAARSRKLERSPKSRPPLRAPQPESPMRKARFAPAQAEPHRAGVSRCWAGLRARPCPSRRAHRKRRGRNYRKRYCTVRRPHSVQEE